MEERANGEEGENEEEPEEEEDEPEVVGEDTIKQANRSGPYAMCKKAGLGKTAQIFNLKNLRLRIFSGLLKFTSELSH